MRQRASIGSGVSRCTFSRAPVTGSTSRSRYFSRVMGAIEDGRASPARVGTKARQDLCTGLVREVVTPVERVEGTRGRGRRYHLLAELHGEPWIDVENPQKERKKTMRYILALVVVALASNARAQGPPKVEVDQNTTCPTGWVSQSEQRERIARYHVLIPTAIQDRDGKITIEVRATSAFVTTKWTTEAAIDAAIASGVLRRVDAVSETVYFCALDPAP